MKGTKLLPVVGFSCGLLSYYGNDRPTRIWPISVWMPSKPISCFYTTRHQHHPVFTYQRSGRRTSLRHPYSLTSPDEDPTWLATANLGKGCWARGRWGSERAIRMVEDDIVAITWIVLVPTNPASTSLVGVRRAKGDGKGWNRSM